MIRRATKSILTRRTHCRTIISSTGAAVVVFLFVLAGTTLFTRSIVMADGIGGGGTGSGGGGHQSSDGWGWRLYAVSGTGPSDGFRNGTAWSTVRRACQDSSTQVAVFVVNDPRNTQMGYDYHSSWYGPPRFAGYLGDSGLPWINMSTAKAGFDALDPSIKRGYTFGSNVSWYCYGSLPKWTTSGTSTRNGPATVTPGTRVTWTHRAVNNGPAKTNKAISANVVRSNFGPATFRATGSSAGVRSGGTVASASTSYTTRASDGGKTLCEHLTWSPNAYDNTRAKSSASACVSVKFSGGVSQQLLFDPDDAVVDDSTRINIIFNATNTTGATLPVNFDGYVWYDRNYNGVLDAGETKLFNKGGSGSLPRSPQTTTVATHAETVDIAKGGRLCAFWNVSSANPLAVNLDGPDVRCAFIGFTPKLQAWGNDMRVGSSFTEGQNEASIMMGRVSTIKSGPSTIYRGSWSEYGLTAPYNPDANTPQSSILNIASAGWPADGSPSATPSQSSWSSLTFGNKFSTSGNPDTATCSFGCFANPDELGVIPGIERYLVQHGLSGKPNVTLRASGSGTYTIDSNIADDGSGVPRIIIADSIAIKDNVTNIDAWLIARDSINTCVKSSGPVDLKFGDCKQTLRINGPIMAKTLIARRIGDIQVDKKSVGEVVNLRGDAYIWAYKTTHTGTAYQTTSVKELPPRY